MPRSISTGAQDFEEIRTQGYFYVDKTGFVRDWWQSRDVVTLVCRPRRFGKTLNLNTVRCFLSRAYAGRGEELFGGLDVWEGKTPADRAEMRILQGTVPLVFVSFADMKKATLEEMLSEIRQALRVAVEEHRYLVESEKVSEGDRPCSRASVTTWMASRQRRASSVYAPHLRRIGT